MQTVHVHGCQRRTHAHRLKIALSLLMLNRHCFLGIFMRDSVQFICGKNDDCFYNPMSGFYYMPVLDFALINLQWIFSSVLLQQQQQHKKHESLRIICPYLCCVRGGFFYATGSFYILRLFVFRLVSLRFWAYVFGGIFA